MKGIISKLPLEERLFWAEAPFAPEEFLRALARDKDPKVRGKVAKNPSASPKILKRFAQDSELEVRLGVARNPSTPPKTLEFLAWDWEYSVRQAVAKNPKTPPSALAVLSEDSDYEVRMRVAVNRNTPKESLFLLAKDRTLHLFLMANPALPPELFAQISGIKWPLEGGNLDEALSLLEGMDKYERVRIAESPSCPPALLSHLAKEGSEDEDEDENWEVRHAVASNPKAGREILEALSRDWDPLVRAGVAENPSCPEDILRDLAQEPDLIRQAVARNPSCPADLLRLLAKDPDPEVREEVAKNPNCPEDLLAEFIAEYDVDVKDATRYKALGKSPEAFLNLILQVFKKRGTLERGEASKLLPFLDRLDRDPKLWITIWRALDERGRELFRAHPFGAQAALLAQLGS